MSQDPYRYEISPAPEGSAVRPGPRNLSVTLLCLGAVAGGVFGGFLSHRYFGTVPLEDMSEEFQAEAERIWPSLDFSAEGRAEVAARAMRHRLKNAFLALGLAGAAVGGLTGLAAAISRKNLRAIVTGLAAGVLAGGGGGLAAAVAGVLVARLLEPLRIVAHDTTELTNAGIRDMYLASTVQAAEWSLIALGTGLAVALTRGSLRHPGRVVGFAVLGALAGTLCYTPVAGAFFSAHGDDSLVFPRGLVKQITFVLLPSLGMALAIPQAFEARQRRSAA